LEKDLGGVAELAKRLDQLSPLTVGQREMEKSVAYRRDLALSAELA
jgi:hypothetical protein